MEPSFFGMDTDEKPDLQTGDVILIQGFLQYLFQGLVLSYPLGFPAPLTSLVLQGIIFSQVCADNL